MVRISDKKQPIMTTVIPAFLLSVIYAVVRYHIFKDVLWTDFPLYTLNKSLALTAAILIAAHSFSKNPAKEYIWYAIHFFIINHVIISLVILGPRLFGKFYSADSLNMIGSLTLLSGIFALTGFWATALRKLYHQLHIKDMFFKQPASVAAIMLLMMLHVFIMGFEGWLTPAQWPGHLMPISLISFLFLSAALSGVIINRKG